MFVKRLDEMRRAGMEVVSANGQARTIHMLTKADGVGFGVSHVCLAAGTEANLWHKHHWPANHVISGKGEVTEITTGHTWALGPSVAYNVDPEDRYRVRAYRYGSVERGLPAVYGQ